MGGEVGFQECIKRFTSHSFFKKTQEEVPLVVGDRGHAVIGVSVFQVQAQVRVVRIGIHDGIHFTHQSLVAQCAQHFADVTTIDGFHDALLEVNCEAFVEPEVVPCCVGDQISAPAVGQLMGHQRDQAPITGNDGWSGKRQPWIFHSAEREGGWQYQEVIALPCILPVEFFCGNQHVLHFYEFIGCGFDQVWGGVDACVCPHGFKHHVTDRQS